MFSIKILLKHINNNLQYKSRQILRFKMDTADMRQDYNGRGNLFLEEHIEKKDPFDLFEKWYKLNGDDPKTGEPNDVFLTTSTKDGYPSGRVALLRGFAKEGFAFSMYYTSREGRDFEENPKAALTFYWEHSSRSVRIEGIMEKSPIAEGDEYFSEKSNQQQIAALLSDQNEPTTSRGTRQQKELELRDKYKKGEGPKPSQWGAYLLRPQVIEFWQGQTDRIHDRIRFRFPEVGEPDNVLTKQGENGWIYERLCP